MVNGTQYKIATLLYSAVSDDAGQTASATILRNFADLTNLTQEAAGQGADIMVFPESMTGTLEWPDFNQGKVAEYAEVYPEVGSVVCSQEFADRFQHYTTACLASDTGMYLVMNIPELLDCTETARRDLLFQSERPAEVTCDDLDEKRVYVFNTLAIYDPASTLIAKYRKTATNPLYYDTAFPSDNREKVDFTTFETDFGVTFGVLVCADATHPQIVPQYVHAGIQNILLPLYDGGRPPVTSISSIHAGLSAHYSINLIASQSQTYSGGGMYSSGTTIDWDIYLDPFSGEPYRKLMVHEMEMNPLQNEDMGVPEDKEDMVDGVDPTTATETCRWLGNADTEVQAPCIRVDVNGQKTAFQGTLTQPLPDGTTMECALQGNLTALANATYAMMVGFRDSTQADYVLFCEIVVCHDFPDCSLDCPLCTAPYRGQAALTDFEVAVKVPEYFERSERMMPLPIMNSLGGKPLLDVEHWGSETTESGMYTRYMSMNPAGSVSNLMGAGIFYIGYAPLTGDDETDEIDEDGDENEDGETSTETDTPEQGGDAGSGALGRRGHYLWQAMMLILGAFMMV